MTTGGCMELSTGKAEPLSVSHPQLLECWQSDFRPPHGTLVKVTLWNPVSP